MMTKGKLSIKTVKDLFCILGLCGCFLVFMPPHPVKGLAPLQELEKPIAGGHTLNHSILRVEAIDDGRQERTASDEARTILRKDIVSIILSGIFFVIGLLALAVFLLHGNSNERLLLWLALFSGLYGLRGLSKIITINLILNITETQSLYMIAWINHVIFVPALLFFEELYGKGWKSSLRWLIWASGVYGVIAILFDIIQGVPLRAPEAVGLMLIPMIVITGIGHYLGYRPPKTFTEIRPMWTGYLIFLGFVIHEHLMDANLLPWRWSLEPLGFLIFICCLGYIAAHRFFANEQQLIALDSEMKSAMQIQASILPGQMPQIENLHVEVRYLPMSSVAGDFYDFLIVDKNRIGLLIADVTGHGVPAALIASMVKVAISSLTCQASNAAQVISGLNEILCQTLRGQMVTAGYLYLDLDKMTGLYSGAGHPPMMLLRKTDSVPREIIENGLPLGFLSDAVYENVEFKLEPGDRILLFTDGITEAMNSAEELYGENRLAQFIGINGALPADKFIELLLKEVFTWAGGKDAKIQTDDLTLLVADIQRSDLSKSIQ